MERNHHHLLTDVEKNINIQNMIFSLRGKQIMIDRDIAQCFGVETRRLNEQVKRNRDRFPDEFCFRLNKKEKDELVAKCDRLGNLKHSTALPFAFTEQGVAMLSAVIKSDTATQASIYIMNAFVNMRRFMIKNSQILDRLGALELKQIRTENKVTEIFKALDHDNMIPKQGVFFDGQIFDAHAFISDLICSANTSIKLIDNYIDVQIFKLLSKKKKGVNVTIYTRLISKHLDLDIKKFNEQYSFLEVIEFRRSHDRFLIIDDKEIYHIGASLKDLGKKWFAFSKLQIDPQIILEQLDHD